MRKGSVLVSPTASKASTTSSTPSRHHGSSSKLSQEAKEHLLSKAQQWREDETVNWSELARTYGLTTANGGQTVKEYLREEGIGIAQESNSKNQSACRMRKRLPEGIPFPMPRPSIFHKKRLVGMVNSGEIAQGTNVVPTKITSMPGKFHCWKSEPSY